MDFGNLTPEPQAQARSCETPDELLALAQQEGRGLSDAQLGR